MTPATLVLGIESSCDETAAAVVADGARVLSNVVHSQTRLHERFGGVVPEVASRSHTQRILGIVQQALADAGVEAPALDAIAVTCRPGMIGSLLVGLSAAKALSFWFDKPLVGVDHIEAHLHAAFMTEPGLPVPCLSLVASGGHTALYRMDGPGRSERLGRTIDDAAGEALDKGAALLGLPYPGGPSIETAAVGGDPQAVKLPRPMLAGGSLDFSFSGMKTALLYHLRGPGLTRPMPELDAAQVRDLAASYQEAIVDTLVSKLRRARSCARTCGRWRSAAASTRNRPAARTVGHRSRTRTAPPRVPAPRPVQRQRCDDRRPRRAPFAVEGRVDGLGLDARATTRTVLAP